MCTEVVYQPLPLTVSIPRRNAIRWGMIAKHEPGYSGYFQFPQCSFLFIWPGQMVNLLGDQCEGILSPLSDSHLTKHIIFPILYRIYFKIHHFILQNIFLISYSCILFFIQSRINIKYYYSRVHMNFCVLFIQDIIGISETCA